MRWNLKRELNEEDSVSSIAPILSKVSEEEVFARNKSWLLCVEYVWDRRERGKQGEETNTLEHS